MGKGDRSDMSKKKRQFYTYSSPLTLKQIEWLRNCPDPPARLRHLIDNAMHNSLEAMKEKRAELYDMSRLLHNCTVVETGKRKKECVKRFQAVMKEITALEKKIEEFKPF